MTKKITITILVLLLFMGSNMPAYGIASNSTEQCIRDAKDEFGSCKDVCLEHFQANKDICRNIDRACAGECSDGYETCTIIPMDIMDRCKALCHSELDAAKQHCIATYPEETAERDTCTDQAQVVAFMCSDECRDRIQNNLKQCRTGLRNCLKICKLPDSQ